MCIIVSKEKNKKIPSKKILENCFKSNPDGAGFMYTFNNKVILEKGFFTFEEFYKRLMEVDKELNLYKKSLIMHFRIGTSGGYTAGVCHPFPISNKESDLQQTEIECDLGMVHNGIMSNYVYGKLSDTQNFVKDFVYPLRKINRNFLNNKTALNLLYIQSSSTKLCFLDKNDHITYIGNFIKDDGIKYSNTSYKEYYYVPTFKKYDYDYDYGYTYKEHNYDNKEKPDFCWLAKDEVKKLKTGMVFYDEEFTEANVIDADDTYYIDELYNLYEIVEEYKGVNSKWLKLKLIQPNIYVYESANVFEELEYKQI